MTADQMLECAARELSETLARLEKFSDPDLHVAAALDHVLEARKSLRLAPALKPEELMARNLANLKLVRQ